MNPDPVVFDSLSPVDTRHAAEAIAPLLRGGDFISLEGDLGAGKTFLVRALSLALGVKEHVASPTFVLQRIYHTGPGAPVRMLLHYDLYRLQSPDELADIGFDDCPVDGAVLAEWGDRFPQAFPVARIAIRLEHVEEDSRRITVVFPDEERAKLFREAVLRLGLE